MSSAGRIMFGLILIAGMVMLGVAALTTYPIPARQMLALTWGVALVVGIAWPAHDASALAARVVPLVGIAVIAPLTLQGLIVTGEHDFNDWCRLAVIATGHTHLALAVLVAQRAHARATGLKVTGLGTIFIVVVVLAAIPTVIPAPFAIITGLPLLVVWPALERWADSGGTRIPRAIVRT